MSGKHWLVYRKDGNAPLIVVFEEEKRLDSIDETVYRIEGPFVLEEGQSGA